MADKKETLKPINTSIYDFPELIKDKKLMKMVLGALCLVLGAYGANAAGELPAGYTAVDYIVAPNGAYIDTGYKPSQNSRTTMDVTVQGAGEYWFGCWDRNYNDGAFAFGNDGGGIYAGYGNQGGTFGSVVANGRHSVELDKNAVKVDGGQVHAFNAATFALANNLYLFAQNRNGELCMQESQNTIICHGCTISEGETPKRNFVPCVRHQDCTAGLYDTVEGKFYGNDGSGSFATSASSLPFGRELTSGTYEITESFAFAASPTESALKIADGAKVTLNIAAGVIVTLRGGDADGTTGAGAGVEVPANATLKVTGGGRLVAYGGKAANGADGANGGNGSKSSSTGNFTSGAGGNGGFGGGGAGAGIGGRGGAGGAGGVGGASVTGYDWSYTDIAGNNGGYGGNGGNGGTCGAVSVEGLVTVIAYGGAAGTADGVGGAAGDWAWLEGSTYYFGGFGGGGGGSGAKGEAAADIGGGGAGGFGGGGGGSGGYLSRYYWDTFSAQPAWGSGGLGAVNGAAGGATSGLFPSVHGASGACGGSGTLTVADGATAYAKESRYRVGRLSEAVEIFYDNGRLLWVSDGISSNLSYSVVDDDTASLGTGWYVVTGTVSRTDRILVLGAANLVLLHNSALTVDCRGITDIKKYVPGIEVCDDNSLGVFGVESGSLTAMGSECAAGIGTAWRFYSDGEVFNCNSCGFISFYGGTVTAMGGENGAGIGGGNKGAGGTVTINGGTVTATGGENGAGIGGGHEGAGGSLTLGPRVFKIDDNHWREGVAVSFVVPADLRVASATGDHNCMEGNRYVAANLESGRTITFAFEIANFEHRLSGNAEVSVGPVFSDVVLDAKQLPRAVETGKLSVDYILANGKTATANDACPLSSIGLTMPFGQSAWYVVTGEVETAVLEVRGTVNLILTDGAKLTANGGIVVNERDTLRIYGQRSGTGQLDATGVGEYRAGIGGNNGACGGVWIIGGTVTATGGENGAGIGGGNQGTGGNILIYGGTVTATGGWNGAGIGGGNKGAGGTVAIYGGTVTATGGYAGAGIGGGFLGFGGSVTIAGGDVEASAMRGEGIGNGLSGRDVKVNLDAKVVVVEGAVGNGSPYVRIVNADDWAFMTVGDLGHLTAAWTSGDGAVTNAIAGGTFPVKKGTENVKVIFTTDPAYSFADGAVATEVLVGRVDADCTVTVPEVRMSEIETFGRGWFVTAPYGAYVDTFFQPGANTRVEMDVLVGDTSKHEYWFGCWDVNWDQDAFALGNDANNQVYCGYGSGAGTHCGGITGVIPSGRVTVALEKGVVYTNGVVWSAAHESDAVFSLANNLYLFAQNRAGTAKPGDGQERIVCYGCRISTNGVNGAAIPVRNFVPARTKDERQIIGLYDTVAGEFFAACDVSLTLGYDEAAVVPVTPGVPVVFDTAAEATNAMARAELTPSAAVAAVFGEDAGAKAAYCEMFGFDVVPSADGKWAIKAALVPEAWTNVVLSAQAATRQIPIADIAALELGDALQNVPLTNCVPGFYYSLYDGTAVTNIKADLNEDNGNILCGPGTTVEIPVLSPPSSASGFFSIGVLEMPTVYIPGSDYPITGGVPVIQRPRRKP